MGRFRGLCISIMFCGFLLGIHDGKVALWVDEDPQPLQVFPYQASLLPEEDQQALRKGIHAGNPQELARLLEDFLS